MTFEVPNLDGMDARDVEDFANVYCTKPAVTLFYRVLTGEAPVSRNGYARTGAQIMAVAGVYARHKAQAMRHRLAGSMIEAAEHEAMCELAYKLLSPNDRW